MDDESSYFTLIPRLRADEYLERVEDSGWTAGWADAARRRLRKNVTRCFEGPAAGRLDVFRALASFELSIEGDVIKDVGEDEESYAEILRAMERGSHGEFRPKEIEDAWVAADKVKRGVYRSPQAKTVSGDLIVVSFRLGRSRYGGVFAGGWFDDGLISFVNEAIRHAGGTRFVVPLPSGREAPEGVRDLASEASTLFVSFVGEAAYDRAVELEIIPWEDHERWPRGDLPSGSIADA